jgi:hypothetical protein
MFAKGKWLALAVILIAGIIAAYSVYCYLYQGAREVSSENAEIKANSLQIIQDYEANSQAADKKYLNKVIEVKGTVTNVADSVITLDTAIFCGLDQLASKSLLAKEIKIKGRCIGFDELFNEVKLDQCTVVE